MKTTALVIVLAAACLTTGATAVAQPYDYRADARYERDHRDYRDYRDHDRRHYRYRHHGRYARGAGPYHDLRPGDRLPAAYWGRQHHIFNWQRAGLPPPMPGCNWVRVGRDVVQSSIYTGKITAILLRR